MAVLSLQSVYNAWKDGPKISKSVSGGGIDIPCKNNVNISDFFLYFDFAG